MYNLKFWTDKTIHDVCKHARRLIGPREQNIYGPPSPLSSFNYTIQ